MCPPLCMCSHNLGLRMRLSYPHVLQILYMCQCVFPHALGLRMSLPCPTNTIYVSMYVSACCMPLYMCPHALGPRMPSVSCKYDLSMYVSSCTRTTVYVSSCATPRYVSACTRPTDATRVLRLLYASSCSILVRMCPHAVCGCSVGPRACGHV
jgi:hypothetical protein